MSHTQRDVDGHKADVKQAVGMGACGLILVVIVGLGFIVCIFVGICGCFLWERQESRFDERLEVAQKMGGKEGKLKAQTKQLKAAALARKRKTALALAGGGLQGGATGDTLDPIAAALAKRRSQTAGGAQQQQTKVRVVTRSEAAAQGLAPPVSKKSKRSDDSEASSDSETSDDDTGASTSCSMDVSKLARKLVDDEDDERRRFCDSSNDLEGWDEEQGQLKPFGTGAPEDGPPMLDMQDFALPGEEGYEEFISQDSLVPSGQIFESGSMMGSASGQYPSSVCSLAAAGKYAHKSQPEDYGDFFGSTGGQHGAVEFGIEDCMAHESFGFERFRQQVEGPDCTKPYM
jgi:hypothetical protein